MSKNILKNTMIFMSVVFVMLIFPNKVNALTTIDYSIPYNTNNFSFYPSNYDFKNDLIEIDNY